MVDCCLRLGAGGDMSLVFELGLLLPAGGDPAIASTMFRTPTTPQPYLQIV